MAYGDFKDLARRTASDKVLRDKTFNTAKNPKYDGYQRIQFLCFLNFLIKNPQVVVLIVKKFKRRRVYSSFKDNIKGVDLADMQLIIKHNKGIRFLLCVIDLFIKYAWDVSLKDKKGVAIANAFQSIINDSKKAK